MTGIAAVMISPDQRTTTITLNSHELRVLSWNIHDQRSRADGTKSDNPEFLRILEDHHIFCLQETKGEILIPNYKCFNKNRAGSRSGGLCIGVHRSLTTGLVEINTRSENIVCVTLEPHKDEGLTIVNVYDSPDNSSYSRRRLANGNDDHQTTLEELLELYDDKLSEKSETVLVGDFNARTGPVNIDFDSHIADSLKKSSPSRSLRSSRDAILNPRGRAFLDVLACTNLRLLNGSIVGDTLGEYTCQTYNGCSVVDYIAVSEQIKRHVSRFQVLELNRFSDHRPCSCTISYNRTDFLPVADISGIMEEAPVKPKWDSSDISQGFSYLNAQKNPNILSALAELNTRACSTKHEVEELNKDIVHILSSVSDSNAQKVRNGQNLVTSTKVKRRPRMRAKNPWFNSACILLKRKVKLLARAYGRSPLNQSTRKEYYSAKKEYRKQVKSAKAVFIADLSRDVNCGKNINWKRFKQLKKLQPAGARLDIFDMRNFVTFFRNLYSKETLSEERLSELKYDNGSANQNQRQELTSALNGEITDEELKSAIRQLKTGKAVAQDCILNEFIKWSGTELRNAIRRLFNICLDIGAYPWNTSLVTPLHKKGSIYDPNNYRAIAVSSNLGKLFSSILLKRLTTFRASACPDTPNQLGFCKGAQTVDHILTLYTCIDKYVNTQKGRLYTCFVDYAKAFDTVSRDALLYKLHKMGIGGKFFDCLSYMYKNSSAKIKLLGKLSEAIDICIGTEQGHPMSPELFKCFIHELSLQLDQTDVDECPKLDETPISHLLWADDLVLMSLSKDGLQQLLNVLFQYCADWGLSVNISKTAVMVFNRSGKLLKESLTLSFGDTQLPSTREYCYLGITFAVSGSLRVTQDKLRQKGFRAYFSLKRTVDVNAMNKQTVFKLFDALVMPVVGYGSQVWLAETNFVKLFSPAARDLDLSLASVARDPMERLHLSFLKWNLGVGKRTSNAPVWGDCGRMPIGLVLLMQQLDYYKRLELMDLEEGDQPRLVVAALREQRTLKLKWFQGIENASRLIGQRNPKNTLNDRFLEIWEKDRKENSKLRFYNKVKETFGLEPYVTSSLKYKERKRVAQLRMSSHQLRVERGRYQQNLNDSMRKSCETCMDTATGRLLAELPFSHQPIEENEEHVIRTCPLYHDIRGRLSESLKSTIFRSIQSMFDEEHIKESARFIKKLFKRRFDVE